MGVMNADIPALVRRSYELGIRHFDTAAGYARGRNEEMVGNVIKELGARDQVIIATKTRPRFRPPATAEQAKASYLELLDASLKRLQTDYVDILYIHAVSDVADVANPALLEAMAAAKKLGKVRAVGFSTHENMAACLDEAVKVGAYDVIVTAYNYAFHQDAELLESMNKAAASGIGLMAMKTQCQQDWYREGLPADLQQYYRGEVVHSALLKWVLNHDCFATAIPGFVNFDQLETDIPCAGEPRIHSRRKEVSRRPPGQAGHDPRLPSMRPVFVDLSSWRRRPRLDAGPHVRLQLRQPDPGPRDPGSGGRPARARLMPELRFVPGFLLGERADRPAHRSTEAGVRLGRSPSSVSRPPAEKLAGFASASFTGRSFSQKKRLTFPLDWIKQIALSQVF